MKKLLVAVLLLGGIGTLAYLVFLNPQRRACVKMVEMCAGEGDHSKAIEQCQDHFAQISKSNPDEAPKLAQCINESNSCSGAVGCQAGSALNMGLNFGKNFLDGLGKSIGGGGNK
ncbi:MAG TPA: hypothetical protein VK447_01055 [Myxococcaceae bacterium]|nr:hypothetical protein [Myxococcaceae bacterium]